MIIRVENARENLIRVHDIFGILNYKCKRGTLNPMLKAMEENSKTIDDIFEVSKKYLGDTKQVKYVKCNFVSRSYEVLDQLPSTSDLRVDYETFMTSLRVKRSREEYSNVLFGILGSALVPEEVEKYARQPRMMKLYYIMEDGSMSTYRLYDFEADLINKSNLLKTKLNVLTEDILEEHSKILDKRMNDYDNIPS